MEGILYALDRQDGCREFELPDDRLGDAIVVSDLHKVLGTSVDRHDLTALKEPLRSHGGITEQRVPLLFNRPVRASIGLGRLRNFDIYDVALNHVE